MINTPGTLGAPARLRAAARTAVPRARTAVPRARRAGRLAAWATTTAALLGLSACVVPPPRHAGNRPMVATQPVAAAPMYFYPDRGQPEAQQDRDRYECYRWAVRESGVDPGMTPVRQAVLEQAVPTVRSRPQGPDVAVGAATGAVIGAAVSSPRHAAENAVLGAIFGATVGSIAHAQNEREAEYARGSVPPPRVQITPGMENFRRAISACMQGRGYRVG